MNRHPHQTTGIAATTRRVTAFVEQRYILEKNGVKLAGHDTIGALLRGIEDKGPGCRILRVKDGCVVWPPERVEGVEET